MINKKVNQYARKFLADNTRTTAVTNETLQRTYKDCVMPAPSNLYDKIIARIEEMKKDSTEQKNVEKMKQYNLRLPEELCQNIKEYLEKYETQSNFIREAIEREIERRKRGSHGEI